MQVRKQQLELGMEQQTGFKKEKEYIKSVEKSVARGGGRRWRRKGAG